MKDTEYGIQAKTLAEEESGDPIYVHWDKIRTIGEPYRKMFEELDRHLINMEKQAKIDTISVDGRWVCNLTLGVPGDLCSLRTSACYTPDEANCEVIAKIRTYINSITAAKFIDEIRPRAATVGLVVKVGYFAGEREDDLVSDVSVYYGNGVPTFKGKPGLSRPGNSDSHEPGALIGIIELSDPLWQTKIINIIQVYEARTELDKFVAKFPNAMLRLSPDGLSFEVPWDYRHNFISEALKPERTRREKCSDWEIDTIASTLSFVPLTKENIEILSEVMIENADNPDDIPEDTDGIDYDAFP